MSNFFLGYLNFPTLIASVVTALGLHHSFCKHLITQKSKKIKKSKNTLAFQVFLVVDIHLFAEVAHSQVLSLPI
jgi:hypothetical protein